MPYSDFTLRKVKQTFGITTVEGQRFLPEIEPLAPSATLRGDRKNKIPADHSQILRHQLVNPIAAGILFQGKCLSAYLEESLPLAIATGSEKPRSELIISPVLLEVRKILKRQISLFSGSDFTVDPASGLSGVCNFILSRSSEQLEIEAPAVVIIEAKKADLNPGIGECIAEMIAAQKFNEVNHQSISTIYGSVTNGTAWRFLQLIEQTVTIDLTDYPLPPVDFILGILVWMVTCAN